MQSVKAHISKHSERYEDWLKVFGSDQVYITGFHPGAAVLPGIGPDLVYLLDLKRLSAGERRRLVEHISERFGIPAKEVDSNLEEEGVPIRAEDVIVSAQIRGGQIV